MATFETQTPAEQAQAAQEGLPEALAKMSKPKALFDVKGFGKLQTLGDNAEAKFRLWSVKLEDYVFEFYGEGSNIRQRDHRCRGEPSPWDQCGLA